MLGIPDSAAQKNRPPETSAVNTLNGGVSEALTAERKIALF